MKDNDGIVNMVVPDVLQWLGPPVSVVAYFLAVRNSPKKAALLEPSSSMGQLLPPIADPIKT